MIIGLAGFKGSGKDTAGAYLVKQHDFERRAFADPLKRSVAALFNIPFSEIEKMKNHQQMFVGVGRISGAGYMQPQTKIHTFREMLQRYGTEAHRDIFGDNFWVDQTLPLSPGRYIGRKIVITDVRFSNEAARIRELDGIVVRIDRPVIPALPVQPLESAGDFVLNDTNSAADLKGSTGPPRQSLAAELQHASEHIDFEADYTLLNDSDVATLHNRIETVLNAIVSRTKLTFVGGRPESAYEADGDCGPS